ncbi:hypothetical protein B1F79_04005 [Coxiella-like endosymbiont of Rhipicephalus sanguineus]|uniref:DUF4160 domain-containing protein n=1 Tax=Coxiella-like endosymbiont of Rhipicephalus sanguineus TaxID=1955402 RepID=UPI003557F5FA|nr:hypothetical protein [Coxiella-like endosymbiont of Rhipicephalus sanguineus]
MFHVEYGDKVSKLQLNPINLASSSGLRSYKLTKIRAIVIEYSENFLEKYEYLGR